MENNLLASWGKEKEIKSTSEKKRKRKKFVRLQPPRLELTLHAFPAFQTVYQRIELT